MTSLSPKEFIKFLKDNEILTAVIAALIFSQAADLANSFLIIYFYLLLVQILIRTENLI